MKITWKEAVQDRHFLLWLGLSCFSLLMLILFAPYFFREIIGPKKGLVLNDWLLSHLNPSDWSIAIFVLIYSTIALTLFTHFRNPHIMVVGLATYCGVTWLRLFAMYIFTLEAPPGMIYLSDPFLSIVVYPQTFAKDLFFSGHISTMMVLIFIEPVKILKWIKIAATVAAAILILIQHVHYSVDVIFAPLFTYLIHRLVIQSKKPQIS